MKVLFLDGSWECYVPRFRKIVENIEFTNESFLTGSRYSATANFLRMLEEITLKEDFDLIVLGNNNGVGITKAAAINKEQISKVVVVSNGPLSPGEQQVYQRMGIKSFVDRSELYKILETELGLE